MPSARRAAGILPHNERQVHRRVRLIREGIMNPRSRSEAFGVCVGRASSSADLSGYFRVSAWRRSRRARKRDESPARPCGGYTDPKKFADGHIRRAMTPSIIRKRSRTDTERIEGTPRLYCTAAPGSRRKRRRGARASRILAGVRYRGRHGGWKRPVFRSPAADYGGRPAARNIYRTRKAGSWTSDMEVSMRRTIGVWALGVAVSLALSAASRAGTPTTRSSPSFNASFRRRGVTATCCAATTRLDREHEHIALAVGSKTDKCGRKEPVEVGKKTSSTLLHRARLERARCTSCP